MTIDPNDHLGLVYQAATDYAGRTGIERDDLVGEGTIGLMAACEGFKPELGYQFSTYATLAIRRHMMKYIRRYYFGQFVKNKTIMRVRMIGVEKKHLDQLAVTYDEPDLDPSSDRRITDDILSKANDLQREVLHLTARGLRGRQIDRSIGFSDTTRIASKTVNEIRTGRLGNNSRRQLPTTAARTPATLFD
jgi:RNA polymerase sigma factor (sigma-70 family)